LDLEKQKSQQLEKELENIARGGHFSNRHVDDYTSVADSERDIAHQLSVQLQRVHATETKFKKQIEEQAQKIAAAEDTIYNLTAQNQAYKDELMAKHDEANKMNQKFSNLQEMTSVVKNYETELKHARGEREKLNQELANEKQTVAERDVLIERLSEIVRIQKSALERIESAQLALKE
jgi:predicted RNase H-like nuclease (RuvC/YqgF family)